MALSPSVTVREAWTIVGDAAAWAGVNREAWQKVATELGDPDLKSHQLLGGNSDEDFRVAVGRVAPPLSALQRPSMNFQTGSKWHFCVPTMILQTLASPLQQASSSSGSAAIALAVPDAGTMQVASTTPKFKLSQVINQAKDAEIALLDEDTARELRKNYEVLCGDAPVDNVDVSDSQVSALSHVLQSGVVLYADFGQWGPRGLRLERRMKFKARVMDSTVSWTQREIPGPD